jgi:hypothetical protein
MKQPRIREIIFFHKQGTVEVRSQPLWIKVIEFWFLWVHELTYHTIWVRIPQRVQRWLIDPYWGDPMEAAFHRFYTWTLNYDVRIDETANFTTHVTIPCDDCHRTDGTHDWDVEH